MEAIDTNVLVRYLTGDDKLQLELAANFVESGAPKLVNPIVLAELSWVLKSVYTLDRATIAEVIRTVGSCGYFVYKRSRSVNAAIKEYVQGFDLADALIVHLNADDGATLTYTFDKKAAGLSGVQLLR